MVELATLTKLYVNTPAVVVGAATVTLLPTVVVTVRFAPPFMVYVNVKGATPLAPVKVNNRPAPFLQTVVVPKIVAVGNCKTVTVAVPDCVCVHVVVGLVTPTKL